MRIYEFQSIHQLHRQKKTPILKLKLSFMAHDLRTFQSNPPAKVRLEPSVSRHNIALAYLAESEAARALATPPHAFRLSTITRNIMKMTLPRT